MSQVWLITGVNRNLGAAIALAALTVGHKVIGTLDGPAQVPGSLAEFSDQLLALPLDSANQATVDMAVARGKTCFGRLDVLVNSVGNSQLGAFQDLCDADIESQFSTNVFSIMKLTRAVLPIMRKQRSGHIFNVSCVVEDQYGKGSSVYAAAMAALEGFSESLDAELTGSGIKVSLVIHGKSPSACRDIVPVADGKGLAKKPGAARASGGDPTRLSRVHQNGDGPANKLGRAIVLLAEVANPPRRFVANSYSISHTEKKIAAIQAELENWRELAMGTEILA